MTDNQAANGSKNRRPEELPTSAYWREKAEAARALAAEMSERGGKPTMEQIAKLYDEMAASAERREGAPRKRLPSR
jgi:hypothetical protein